MLKSTQEAIKNIFSSYSTKKTTKTNKNNLLSAPLPDPITKNIEAVIMLHTKEAKDIPYNQKILENVARFLGTSIFLYSLLLFFIFWIFSDLFNNFLPFHFPPFSWSEHGLDTAALLISTGVLVRQTRQENFAEQRMQLMLQVNLLSEQKVAKIIALLEELRADLPFVADRVDVEAELMQEAADPHAVLEAIKENLMAELDKASE